MRIPEELLKILWDVAPAVILAIIGGTVRMLQNPKSFSWCWFAGGILMSAFVGVIVFLLLADTDILTPNCRAAICGVAGYSSAQILAMLEKRVLSVVTDKVTGDKK